jgi:hypothetical protein
MENFEIMSAYYVDIFYNHLYTEAKKLKVNGSVSSVTEGYKHTLNAFLKGLTNPKLYKKSISGLHHYFITIGFASISYAKCIDRLTHDFVPSDYFNSLTFTQKIGVLRLIINQSVKSFIKKIVDEHMSKIIDFHKDKDNARLLQDEFIDCLIIEREGFYQRFIATHTKTNKNETVNRLLSEKMQIEIKRLVKEKYEQKRQILILKKAYIQKKESENLLNETINELRQKIQTLESEQSNHHSQQRPKFPTHYNKTSEPMRVSARPQTTQHLKIDTDTEQSAYVESQPLTTTVVAIKKETPNVTIETDGDDSTDSNFIEVNSTNMSSVLQGDRDILQNLHDSDIFDATMDEGTSLDDFN